MLPSGVATPPSCAAGIASPSVGFGSVRPLITTVAPSALPVPALPLEELPPVSRGGEGERKRLCVNIPQSVFVTPRAYVTGWARTASTPTSRNQRWLLFQPFVRSESATRSSCMRELASLKKRLRSIPYERYGSFVNRSRCTARASSRDAGPFEGSTILSVTKAR